MVISFIEYTRYLSTSSSQCFRNSRRCCVDETKTSIFERLFPILRPQVRCRSYLIFLCHRRHSMDCGFLLSILWIHHRSARLSSNRYLVNDLIKWLYLRKFTAQPFSCKVHFNRKSKTIFKPVQRIFSVSAPPIPCPSMN
jgi:hypothetical protein